MATFDPSQLAFEAAKDAFRKSLKNQKLYQELLATTSIEKVWEAAKEVQAKQDAERRLRRMGKISGFLAKLEAYAIVVDTFVQVKPDIMALIWGPIRMLLVWTANITKFSDAIVSVVVKIGDALPHFTELAQTFSQSDKIREVLVLFYRDILDFYAIALEFFSLSRPKLFFESIWPKQRDRIDVVTNNIEQHVALFRNEVTVQHIREEYEARAKALARFDQENEFQELQKFHALKTCISPGIYDGSDDRLDWLLNRASRGSDAWLLTDNTFQEWLDISNPATRLLWLHGIPGAGKTFLAAAAIREAKKRHQTLFVFASHTHQSITTARSILQSLLFQLAFDDKDARALLVRCKERDLHGSTSYVSDILKTALNDTMPTYIVLDGLDEMEGSERRILLQELAALYACPKIKVLVGSRPEDDIARILETNFTAIRVDKRNSGSIESYVNQRTRDWLRSVGFGQRATDQIQYLLAPLAANANGMFLYVRIVLDNAELCTDLEEIERELTALPLDLNEAYHRIFSRINESQPVLRQKARKILGWIGFAPTPMTRYEMEQMLLVDDSSDSKAAPCVAASVNFVRICGPIIEMVDESPQFVHATVKDYVFSNQIANFIDKAEANYTLAKSSLTYLCSNIFKTDISDMEIQNGVLSGRYRLCWFVMRQWIVLTKRCLDKSKDLSAYPDLQTLLIRLVLELRNYEFEEKITGFEKDIAAFEGLDSDGLQISRIIGGALQFVHDERQADWNCTNDQTWENYDPTTLSIMSVRIYKHFENLICDEGQGRHRDQDCHCGMLQQHYGSKIFKCTYPSCDRSRMGFDERSARNTHVANHTRPWKCSVPECLYANIGFASIRGRDNHWRKIHLISQPPVSASFPRSTLSGDNLKVLVFELTKAGDADRLQQIAPYLAGKFSLTRCAMALAAKMGSLLIVEILSQWAGGWDRWDVWAALRFQSAVMESDNPDLFRWLLDWLTNVPFQKIACYSELAAKALTTNSPDKYAEWEEFLLDPTRDFLGHPDDMSHREFDAATTLSICRTLIPQHEKRSVLFYVSAFKATGKSAVFQTRLIQTWHRLIHDVLGDVPLNPWFLGWSLTCLAKSLVVSRPYEVMAAELLRLGAPIDFPRGRCGIITEEAELAQEPQPRLPDAPATSKRRRKRPRRLRGMTALHFAAKHASEQSARFMRFLLEQGADPDYGYAGMKPAQERGPAMMQKWLGETWEQVVERTLPARLEQKKKEGQGPGEEVSEDDDGDEDGDEEESEEEGEEQEAKKAKRRRNIA